MAESPSVSFNFASHSSVKKEGSTTRQSTIHPFLNLSYFNPLHHHPPTANPYFVKSALCRASFDSIRVFLTSQPENNLLAPQLGVLRANTQKDPPVSPCSGEPGTGVPVQEPDVPNFPVRKHPSTIQLNPEDHS